MTDARRRPPWHVLLRPAWATGEGDERVFATYIGIAPFLAILVSVAVTLEAAASADTAIWIWFVALGGIVVFPAFQGPIYDSAYGLDFIRAILGQDWMRPADREYYAELLRFRSTLGPRGRVTSDVAWAIGYCLLYLGNVAFAELAMVALAPVFGSPIGLALIVSESAVGVVAGIAYSRRTIRRFRAAESQGFRLLELKRATRRAARPV